MMNSHTMRHTIIFPNRSHFLSPCISHQISGCNDGSVIEYFKLSKLLVLHTTMNLHYDTYMICPQEGRMEEAFEVLLLQ